MRTAVRLPGRSLLAPLDHDLGRGALEWHDAGWILHADLFLVHRLQSVGWHWRGIVQYNSADHHIRSVCQWRSIENARNVLFRDSSRLRLWVGHLSLLRVNWNEKIIYIWWVQSQLYHWIGNGSCVWKLALGASSDTSSGPDRRHTDILDPWAGTRPTRRISSLANDFVQRRFDWWAPFVAWIMQIIVNFNRSLPFQKFRKIRPLCCRHWGSRVLRSWLAHSLGGDPSSCTTASNCSRAMRILIWKSKCFSSPRPVHLFLFFTFLCSYRFSVIWHFIDNVINQSRVASWQFRLTSAMKFFTSRKISLSIRWSYSKANEISRTKNKKKTIIHHGGNSISNKFGVVAMASGIIGVPLGSYLAQRFRLVSQKCDPLICAYGLFVSSPMVFLALALAAVNTTWCFFFVFIAEISLNLCWSIVADILLVSITLDNGHHGKEWRRSIISSKKNRKKKIIKAVVIT